ncbi:GyrI-like domain-containing protein [Paenibacillus sp. NPDC057967]|uniref:AraC family transcriptional regulator n=1 Tax=Paenibacillus sp. NPDC057967 TaxID=3346293 RepID=UPI0036DC5068
MRNLLIEKEHHAHIHRVADYIETHLTADLSLEELSKLSAFSPYHFHRIFKAVMNENLHRFITRLRVEKASKLLTFHPERTISDIAMESGLQSSAHFSRTFRTYTGLSPTEYRRRYHLQAITSRFWSQSVPEGEHEERLQLLERKYSQLRIRIEHFPDRQAVCVRYQGTVNTGKYNEDVAKAYEKAGQWLMARDLHRRDTMYIGLVHNDPYVTPASRHRFSACVTTDAVCGVGEEVEPIVIPGGKYAVIRLEERDDVTRDLIYLAHTQWLPVSPYLWDSSRHSMVINLWKPLSDSQVLFGLDFCIPVRPK